MDPTRWAVEKPIVMKSWTYNSDRKWPKMNGFHLGGSFYNPEVSGVLTAPYLYTLVKTNIAIEHGPGRSRCIFLLKVRGYSNQRFVSLAEGNWLQGAQLYTSTPPTSTHFYLHPRVHYRLDITTYSNICTLAKVTKRLQIWPCLVSMLEIMGRQANLNKGYTNTLFFFFTWLSRS